MTDDAARHISRELLAALEFYRDGLGPRRAERSDKVIGETVLRVAERVGVRANVPALRRAFAVAFLTTHPGAIESLQAPP